MYFVVTLKDIFGCTIFVYFYNNERKNDAANVVDFTIFLMFANIESYHSNISILLTTSQILSGIVDFIGRFIGFLPINLMCLI